MPNFAIFCENVEIALKWGGNSAALFKVLRPVEGGCVSINRRFFSSKVYAATCIFIRSVLAVDRHLPNYIYLVVNVRMQPHFFFTALLRLWLELKCYQLPSIK